MIILRAIAESTNFGDIYTEGTVPEGQCGCALTDYQSRTVLRNHHCRKHRWHSASPAGWGRDIISIITQLRIFEERTLTREESWTLNGVRVEVIICPRWMC